ncbi:unnamed protein product [Amoebophrya sp. A120]|nr:unnamed protein product [Amoebophrya sp. A120]|eukprot:GSA120T00001591001.1
MASSGTTSQSEESRLLKAAGAAVEARSLSSTEKQEVVQKPASSDETWLGRHVRERPVLTTILWMPLMLAASAGLIAFNKTLVNGPFPFATALTCWHMFCCTLFAWTMFALQPDCFPTMKTLRQQADAHQTRQSLLFVVPIAVCFSSSVVFSNVAYKYASIAFLQMMKELNVGIIYCFSLLAGIETVQWRLILVLTGLVGASYFSITGEADFVLLGFLVQGACQLLECTRVVATSKVLSTLSLGFTRIDAMSFMLVMSPVSVLYLSVVLWIRWDPLTQERFAENFSLLAGNGLVAVLLNMIIVLTMTAFSPLTMIVAGVVKDVVIVSAGVLLFHEVISAQQCCGFTLQVCCVACYSYLRASSSSSSAPGAKAEPPKEVVRGEDLHAADEETKMLLRSGEHPVVSTDDDGSGSASSSSGLTGSVAGGDLVDHRHHQIRSNKKAPLVRVDKDYGTTSSTSHGISAAEQV